MALTNYIYQFEALDTSSTVGSGKLGLTYSDFTVKFCHPGGTLISATTQDITTLGTYQAPSGSNYIRIKEINGTNPTIGIYEAHLHDDRVNHANGDRLWVYMSASGSKITPTEINLKDTNYLADTILTRDFTAVSGEANRSLLNSVRFLRNNWYTSNNYLYVTEEDDTTVAWSGALSIVNGGSGITGMDPF